MHVTVCLGLLAELAILLDLLLETHPRIDRLTQLQIKSQHLFIELIECFLKLIDSIIDITKLSLDEGLSLLLLLAFLLHGLDLVAEGLLDLLVFLLGCTVPLDFSIAFLFEALEIYVHLNTLLVVLFDLSKQVGDL